MGANLGGSGLGEVWSGNCSVERGHMVTADFGQTDFGQTDFGQFFDRFWPIVILTDFGQTDIGQFLVF